MGLPKENNSKKKKHRVTHNTPLKKKKTIEFQNSL